MPFKAAQVEGIKNGNVWYAAQFLCQVHTRSSVRAISAGLFLEARNYFCQTPLGAHRRVYSGFAIFRVLGGVDFKAKYGSELMFLGLLYFEQ